MRSPKLIIYLLPFLFLYSIESKAQKKKKQKEAEPHMMTLDSLGNQYKNVVYPHFSFTTLDGKTINSENTKGKTVFLNFWFEACVPCRIEFESLNKLYDSVKNDTSVVFAALTFEKLEQLPGYIKFDKITYPVATLDKEECARLNFYVGYPTSIVINKEGRVALYETGGYLEKEKAEDFFANKVLPLIKDIR